MPARRRALQVKKALQGSPQKNFFRSYVSTEAKNTTTGEARHSKERMYIVDSARFVTHDGIICFEQQREEDHSIVKKNYGCSDGQHASKGLHQEGAWRLSFGTLVEDSPSLLSLRRLCNELGGSFSWPSGEAPRLSKGRKVIYCSTENFVFVVAVTKQKAVPSIEFAPAMGKL